MTASKQLISGLAGSPWATTGSDGSMNRTGTPPAPRADRNGVAVGP